MGWSIVHPSILPVCIIDKGVFQQSGGKIRKLVEKLRRDVLELYLDRVGSRLGGWDTGIQGELGCQLLCVCYDN